MIDVLIRKQKRGRWKGHRVTMEAKIGVMKL